MNFLIVSALSIGSPCLVTHLPATEVGVRTSLFAYEIKGRFGFPPVFDGGVVDHCRVPDCYLGSR